MEGDLDPFLQLRRMFEVIGLVENPNPKYLKLFAITYIWTPVSILIDYLHVMIYCLEDHPFLDKTESMQCFISLINLSGKVLNIRLRKGRVKDLLDGSLVVWKEMSLDQRNEELLKKARNRIKWRITQVMLIFGIVSPLSGVFSFIKNLSKGYEDWDLPFKIWDPVGIVIGNQYYFTRVFVQVFLMGYALILFAVVYITYAVPIEMANVQVDVLVNMMAAKDVDVVACAKFHQKYLKYVKDISDLFTTQMFLDILLSALPVTFRSYQLIVMWNDLDSEVFKVFLVFLPCACAPILICHCGQMITDGSEKLFRGMYQVEWYNMSAKDARIVQLMMLRGSRYLTLHYKTLMTFNMDRLSMVLQATYSYITLLLKYK